MQQSKRLILFFGGLILIASLLACGSTSSNTGTVVNTNPTSSTSGKTPAPSQQHFAVGQVIKVGDTWQVTINSAKTSSGSEFNKPQKTGDVFLVFSITVKNISSQEQPISSALNFSLLDSTGQKYTETIDTDAGSTLDGKVEAGSPLKGAVVYEVPASIHQYQLAFESDIISSGQTIWDIHV